jgi:hypothetical protein
MWCGAYIFDYKIFTEEGETRQMTSLFFVDFIPKYVATERCGSALIMGVEFQITLQEMRKIH